MRRLIRWFKSFTITTEKPITIIQHPIRFTDWKDALCYLNKPVVVCKVEDTDVRGIMEAIRLIHDSEKNVVDCYIGVKGYWYNYYSCKPDNKKTK